MKNISHSPTSFTFCALAVFIDVHLSCKFSTKSLIGIPHLECCVRFNRVNIYISSFRGPMLVLFSIVLKLYAKSSRKMRILECNKRNQMGIRIVLMVNLTENSCIHFHQQKGESWMLASVLGLSKLQFNSLNRAFRQKHWLSNIIPLKFTLNLKILTVGILNLVNYAFMLLLFTNRMKSHLTLSLQWFEPLLPWNAKSRKQSSDTETDIEWNNE